MQQFCSVVPTTELTQNDWLRHGCISCIRERRGIDDLLKPIEINSYHLGYGTSINGVCCNGHKFSIQSPVNKARKYSDPSISCNEPGLPKYINYDCNILAVLAAYMNGGGGTEFKRVAASLNLKNFKSADKVFDKTSKKYVAQIIIEEARKTAEESLIDEIRLSFSHKYPLLDDHDWHNFHELLMKKQQDNADKEGHNSDSSDSVQSIHGQHNAEEEAHNSKSSDSVQSPKTSSADGQSVDLTCSNDMGW